MLGIIPKIQSGIFTIQTLLMTHTIVPIGQLQDNIYKMQLSQSTLDLQQISTNYVSIGCQVI